MKNMDRKLVVIVFSTMLFAIVSGCSSSQKVSQAAMASTIDSLVGIKKIEFRANKAIPMGFSPVNLSYGYGLSINKDTVRSYLPFYGRAYSAEYGGESGIKFTSTTFEYAVKSDKKGFHNITIEPRDTPKKYKLYLSIGPAGYSTLTVADPDKQPITFYGTIEH